MQNGCTAAYFRDIGSSGRVTGRSPAPAVCRLGLGPKCNHVLCLRRLANAQFIRNPSASCDERHPQTPQSQGIGLERQRERGAVADLCARRHRRHRAAGAVRPGRRYDGLCGAHLPAAALASVPAAPIAAGEAAYSSGAAGRAGGCVGRHELRRCGTGVEHWRQDRQYAACGCYCCRWRHGLRRCDRGGGARSVQDGNPPAALHGGSAEFAAESPQTSFRFGTR